ncbi:hypothetical protein WMY93_030916 [Mugilogobius chulae]|uniref:Uncharacterized protein n=1 Tax=Mugilogobius chulae TaxID=88201 RepID=A0AAW0MPW7_9GOBI
MDQTRTKLKERHLAADLHEEDPHVTYLHPQDPKARMFTHNMFTIPWYTLSELRQTRRPVIGCQHQGEPLPPCPLLRLHVSVSASTVAAGRQALVELRALHQLTSFSHPTGELANGRGAAGYRREREREKEKHDDSKGD